MGQLSHMRRCAVKSRRRPITATSSSACANASARPSLPGELTGKLPGERELARQFQVNAKTLSKALTDLAAEGLLSRSIGRGTFVKGADAQAKSSHGPWLLLVRCRSRLQSPLGAGPLAPQSAASSTVAGSGRSLRPSFLNQFSAVVDLCAASTPPAFVRDLLVRNLPLVVVGREPGTLIPPTPCCSTWPTSPPAWRRTCSWPATAASPSFETARKASQDGPAGQARCAAAIRPLRSRNHGGTVPLLQLSRPFAIRRAGRHRLWSAIRPRNPPGIASSSRSERKRPSPSPRVVSVAAVGLGRRRLSLQRDSYLNSEQQADAIVHLLQHGRSSGGTGRCSGSPANTSTRGTTSVASAPPGAGRAGPDAHGVRGWEGEGVGG
jgi:hypothetical protein